MKRKIRINHQGLQVTYIPKEEDFDKYDAHFNRVKQMSEYGTPELSVVLENAKQNGLGDKINDAYQEACDKKSFNAITGLMIGGIALYLGSELDPGIAQKASSILGGIGVLGNGILLGINEMRRRSFEYLIK